MFDLENAITAWRDQMFAAGVKTPVPLEELECHLREDIEQQVSSGTATPEAFTAAVQRLGQGDALREEFRKANGLLEPLMTAPPLLLAYALFAVVVTLMDYGSLLFAPTSFREHIIPYTGWVASMFYSFTIFFAVALIYQREKRGAIRSHGITRILQLQIAFGIFGLFQIGGPNFGSPYLTVSPWRPLWTILIPALWIAILHTPRVNRFCRPERKELHV